MKNTTKHTLGLIVGFAIAAGSIEIYKWIQGFSFLFFMIVGCIISGYFIRALEKDMPEQVHQSSNFAVQHGIHSNERRKV